jgi:hypothetical protein
MAKSLLHNQALALRRRGWSVRRIASELRISKDSASKWTRDVILTIEQLENLQKKLFAGRERGRLLANLKRRQDKDGRIESAKQFGLKTLNRLTRKELLVAGLALYAGEGVKKRREVRFCNTDPAIINFMINWLIECFGVTISDFHCAVGINEAHKNRDVIVRKYWSNITGIPLASFRKTSFKKAISKKVYENFNEHYGTLDVRLLRSTQFYDRIMGLIHGLFSQGNSVVECRPHKAVVGSPILPLGT